MTLEQIGITVAVVGTILVPCFLSYLNNTRKMRDDIASNSNSNSTAITELKGDVREIKAIFKGHEDSDNVFHDGTLKAIAKVEKSLRRIHRKIDKIGRRK